MRCAGTRDAQKEAACDVERAHGYAHGWLGALAAAARLQLDDGSLHLVLPLGPIADAPVDMLGPALGTLLVRCRNPTPAIRPGLQTRLRHVQAVPLHASPPALQPEIVPLLCSIECASGCCCSVAPAHGSCEMDGG